MGQKAAKPPIRVVLPAPETDEQTAEDEDEDEDNNFDKVRFLDNA